MHIKFWPDNLKEKSSRGIPRYKWDNNINTEKEGGKVWTGFQDWDQWQALVNMTMNFQVP
jgi:hypothetical protein